MRSPVKQRERKKSLLAGVPETPGVYLFYNDAGMLLYVGKSKSIRSRVRAHFTTASERRMMRAVSRIDTRPTAGELGALLLESQLIKDLHPVYNVMARRRRRIVLARGRTDANGYLVVEFQPIDYLDIRPEAQILGLFKHRTQAQEFLADAARRHSLCPKLLRIERARTYCFSYHLGRCHGACMGEEEPERYNERVLRAFGERRIKAWPYPGPVAVEETSAAGERETFVIDNWCLLARYRNGDARQGVSPEERDRFDYDSYKILYSHLTAAEADGRITILKPTDGGVAAPPVKRRTRMANKSSLARVGN